MYDALACHSSRGLWIMRTYLVVGYLSTTTLQASQPMTCVWWFQSCILKFKTCRKGKPYRICLVASFGILVMSAFGNTTERYTASVSMIIRWKKIRSGKSLTIPIFLYILQSMWWGKQELYINIIQFGDPSVCFISISICSVLELSHMVSNISRLPHFCTC